MHVYQNKLVTKIYQVVNYTAYSLYMRTPNQQSFADHFQFPEGQSTTTFARRMYSLLTICYQNKCTFYPLIYSCPVLLFNVLDKNYNNYIIVYIIVCNVDIIYKNFYWLKYVPNNLDSARQNKRGKFPICFC